MIYCLYIYIYIYKFTQKQIYIYIYIHIDNASAYVIRESHLQHALVHNHEDTHTHIDMNTQVYPSISLSVSPFVNLY